MSALFPTCGFGRVAVRNCTHSRPPAHPRLPCESSRPSVHRGQSQALPLRRTTDTSECSCRQKSFGTVGGSAASSSGPSSGFDSQRSRDRNCHLAERHPCDSALGLFSGVRPQIYQRARRTPMAYLVLNRVEVVSLLPEQNADGMLEHMVVTLCGVNASEGRIS